MCFWKYLGAGCLVSVILIAGCGPETAKSKNEPAKSAEKKQAEKKDSGHDHGKGPNGGVVFDLGKYHAEFTVDHDKKECTVLVLNGEEKDTKPLPVSAKELSLTTKESKTKEGKVVPPMTIKMLPKDEKDGKAAKFVGTDPGLGNVADFEGTVHGEMDGKPAEGKFKE